MKLSLIILSWFLFCVPALAQLKTENEQLNHTSSSINLIAGWKASPQRTVSSIQPRKKTLRALEVFKDMPELDPYFNEANGYAVFPNIGKGGIGIGGAHGKGEVFQNDNVIGSTTMSQFSIGFQLGGQAFSQIIFFKDERDLDRFTEGNFEFGASASAALINAGAAVETEYSDGIAVLTVSKGGLMYEAAIGGQKFSFNEYD